jgi:hypothetical protein
MYLFMTSESHQWRFGWPSDEDRKLEEKPLSFLKRTVPWFVPHKLLQRADCDVFCRFSVYPRAEDFWVDNNVKLLQWAKAKEKVQKCGEACT